MTIVTGIANAVLSSISTRFGQRRKDRLAFDLLSQNVHLTLQADDLLPQMQNSRRAGKIDAEIVHQTPDALNSLDVGIRIEPLPPSARGFEESPFFVAPERSGLHAQASCDNGHRISRFVVRAVIDDQILDGNLDDAPRISLSH